LTRVLASLTSFKNPGECSMSFALRVLDGKE